MRPVRNAARYRVNELRKVSARSTGGACGTGIREPYGSTDRTSEQVHADAWPRRLVLASSVACGGYHLWEPDERLGCVTETASIVPVTERIPGPSMIRVLLQTPVKGREDAII